MKTYINLIQSISTGAYTIKHSTSMLGSFGGLWDVVPQAVSWDDDAAAKGRTVGYRDGDSMAILYPEELAMLTDEQRKVVTDFVK